MFRFSPRTRSIRSAAAGLLLVGLLSSANAFARSTSLEILPDLPARGAEHIASAEPTSRLPWLAPVGHHQPRRDDVPPSSPRSASENEQQRLDQILNRKLIICRGC